MSQMTFAIHLLAATEVLRDNRGPRYLMYVHIRYSSFRVTKALALEMLQKSLSLESGYKDHTIAHYNVQCSGIYIFRCVAVREVSRSLLWTMSSAVEPAMELLRFT